jgi:hypothetical protein
VSTSSTPDTNTTSTSTSTANAHAFTVIQAIQTTPQPIVSQEQGQLQDARDAPIHETGFVPLRSPSASDTTSTAKTAALASSMNPESEVPPQPYSNQSISNLKEPQTAPSASSQETGFLFLRASILKRNTDPATKKRETTVHVEVLSYSSLNYQVDGGETRPVFARRFIIEQALATPRCSSQSRFTSFALISLLTNVSIPIPPVNGKNEALQFWKKLGIVEKAYYTPYLNRYNVRLKDYKIQKTLWNDALQRYPWSPTIATRFPTWAHCEPQFLRLGEDVAAFCGALNEWATIQQLQESRSSA